jgi:hypothetical protein
MSGSDSRASAAAVELGELLGPEHEQVDEDRDAKDARERLGRRSTEAIFGDPCRMACKSRITNASCPPWRTPRSRGANTCPDG